MPCAETFLNKECHFLVIPSIENGKQIAHITKYLVSEIDFLID